MNTAMQPLLRSPIATNRPQFITPLTGDGLLDPGEVMLKADLVRRILSLCWRDCCLPRSFSRAPAPVIQTTTQDGQPGTNRQLAAWWLLPDGIIADFAGPHSERLRPFLGSIGRTGQLWPRYEFQISTVGTEVSGDPATMAEITIYPEPMISNRQRIWLAEDADGRLRITTRDFKPGR